jgi:1-deoxy-D-xylulose-5-phosphate synthase
VALQGLAVVLCLDRAGLVGEDGPTHHGVFDIAYTRTLPHFTVMAPKDGLELEMMLEKALALDSPVAIRFPRDVSRQLVGLSSYAEMEIGRAEKLRDGKDVVLIAVGSMVNTALLAAEVLSRDGIEASVVNARFVKPLDGDMLEKVFSKVKRAVTIEEGVASGGFGSAVLEFIASENIQGIHLKCISLPDEFIEHGAREELLRKYHLVPDEIAATIKAEMFN